MKAVVTMKKSNAAILVSAFLVMLAMVFGSAPSQAASTSWGTFQNPKFLADQGITYQQCEGDSQMPEERTVKARYADGTPAGVGTVFYNCHFENSWWNTRHGADREQTGWTDGTFSDTCVRDTKTGKVLYCKTAEGNQKLREAEHRAEVNSGPGQAEIVTPAVQGKPGL